ncbi:MAG: NGG1p interacting factor NIF3 [Bacteroidetes bacterium]|nr:MAG: NGG1p interacting factor NIF3 [Bacteroidota bacterium]
MDSGFFQIINRRKFVQGIIACSGLIPVIGKSAALNSKQESHAKSAVTVQEIIDLFLSEIPGAPYKQTVDTIKCGRPDQQVSGIVTTMLPTVDVIRKTANLKANFIIAHEPSFYNHNDETNWLEKDPVYNYKADLLNKNQIAIWRCHDYIHSHVPDGVLIGVLIALGWDKYYDKNNPHSFVVPEMKLKDIVDLSKKKLGISKMKIIGEPDQLCKKIAISPGAAGGRSQMQTIMKEKPDVFICGELNEWETSEYIRDMKLSGGKTSLLVLGHAVSEEPGMQWMKSWLEAKLPNMKVTHIPSGDPFTWV